MSTIDMSRSRRDTGSLATELQPCTRATWRTTRPRLLVADDDPSMLSLVADQLRRAGYQVVQCSDGTGLAKCLASTFLSDARPNEFDLVVSDVRMPGLSGLEVLEAVHDRAEFPPMILITAFGDRETHARAERLGAVAMMDKPFRIRDLVALVDRTIEEQRRPAGGL